jgi:hypothetical protein
MSALKIYQAFVNQFSTGSLLTGLGVAYENSSFTPTAGTAYAELRFFPNETGSLSLKNKNETTGVFSVILRYPIDSGAIVLKSKAQAIVDAFKPGSFVSYTGQRVDIVNSSVGSGVSEDGWFKQIVDIRFRAFSAR